MPLHVTRASVVLVLFSCVILSHQAAAQTPADGGALYSQYCALCHGPQGKGYAADNAPSLISKSFLSTASDAFMHDAIAYGRPGTPMAAFGTDQGGPLSADQIKAMTTWLRAQAKVTPRALDTAPVAGDKTLGAEVYADECAQCHGADGNPRAGSAAPPRGVSLSNPRFLASASDAFIQHAIREGREGTTMVAYSSRLSKAQIDGVTAHIRSWAKPVDAPKPVGKVPSVTELILNPGNPAPSFTLQDGRYVAAADLKAALDAKQRLALIDARPMSDWLTSHIPGAIPIPYYDVEKLAATLPKDGTMIVAYCACPHAASDHVVNQLRAKGFNATAVLDEGFVVWTERGYPVIPGVAPDSAK